jgi:histidine phosphotransfer protein HptB
MSMAYDPGALEAVLAAAVGAESSLVDELRGAFFSSADDHLSAMRVAHDADEWVAAAGRLKGLAASFGALRVLDAANAAAMAVQGDVRAIARIERALSALRHEPVA